jgi:hypothetical protein
MMMKIWVALPSVVASILIFALPAWAVSLKSSFLIEENRHDFRPPLNIETNGTERDLFTLPDTDRSAMTTLTGENIYTTIFEDQTGLTENPMYTVETKNQNVGGATPVPEPATLVLLGSGLIGITFLGRKKRRSAK